MFALFSFVVDRAVSSARQISSRLKLLKLWNPENAFEHPAYSEITIDEFSKSFRIFLTVTNSSGGKHSPSLSVEISSICVCDQTASLFASGGLPSCRMRQWVPNSW